MLQRSAWFVAGAVLSRAAFGCGGSSVESGSPLGGGGAGVAGNFGVVGGAETTVSGLAGAPIGDAGLGNHRGGVGGGGASGLSGSAAGGAVGGSAVGGQTVGDGGVSGSAVGGESVGGGGIGGNGGAAGSASSLGTCERLPGYDVDCARAYTDKPQAYGCKTETVVVMMRANSNWKCDTVQLVEAARFNICCPL